MNLRDATFQDTQPISALLAELGYPLTPEVVRTNLARVARLGPAFFIIVAVEADQVVGVASGFATPVLHREQPVGRLSVLVVARSHAGLGVGSTLVAAAENRFASLGCRRIEVTSAGHRHEAHAFYRRRGYDQQGLRFVRELAPGETEGPA